MPVLTGSAPPPGARDLAATAAIVALVAGFAIASTWGSKPQSPLERCVALLDRFVELRTRAADPKTTRFVLETKQADARTAVAGSDELARCADKLTEESSACADGAGSADELERCFL